MTAGGDRLHIDAPKGAISPELKAGLAQHKAELLALLGAGDLPAEAVISASTPAAEAPTLGQPGRAAAAIDGPKVAPAWAGVAIRLEDLADFKARWGLRLVDLDWPPGNGPAVGTFAPV